MEQQEPKIERETSREQILDKLNKWLSILEKDMYKVTENEGTKIAMEESGGEHLETEMSKLAQGVRDAIGKLQNEIPELKVEGRN